MMNVLPVLTLLFILSGGINGRKPINSKPPHNSLSFYGRQGQTRQTRGECSFDSYDVLKLSSGETVPITVPSGSTSFCGLQVIAAKGEVLTLRCSMVDLPQLFAVYALNARENLAWGVPFQHTFIRRKIFFNVFSGYSIANLVGTVDCEVISSLEPPELTIVTPAPTVDNDGCQCGVPNADKIVGGEDADTGEYPWQVSIQYSSSHYCGGSLVSPTKVITAAHCQVIPGDEIVLGEHDLSANEDFTVKKFVQSVSTHHKYDNETNNNDIAVVTIEAVQVSSKISPICLPVEHQSYNKKSLVATGWGTTSEGGNLASVLQEVEVRGFSNRKCRNLYFDYTITGRMLCAGVLEGGKGTCQGDSGGPLVYQDDSNVFELVGVTSWGIGCARPNFPGIYARVTRLASWLDNEIGTEDLCPRP